jgi:hypothetical protein
MAMSSSTRVLGLRNLTLLALAIVPSACTTRVLEPGPAAEVAPQLAVERFLQAANARDLLAMGRLFGTPDGPVTETGGTFGCMFKKIGSWFGGQSCDTRQNVEIRINAIASILRHENYRIVREEMVAGRDVPTTRVVVTLTINGASVNDVPFVVVQASEGRWLVQEIDLERVMAGG